MIITVIVSTITTALFYFIYRILAETNRANNELFEQQIELVENHINFLSGKRVDPHKPKRFDREAELLKIMEDAERNREKHQIVLWLGLDGLRLNDDGTTEWISRREKDRVKKPKPNNYIRPADVFSATGFEAGRDLYGNIIRTIDGNNQNYSWLKVF